MPFRSDPFRIKSIQIKSIQEMDPLSARGHFGCDPTQPPPPPPPLWIPPLWIADGAGADPGPRGRPFNTYHLDRLCSGGSAELPHQRLRLVRRPPLSRGRRTRPRTGRIQAGPSCRWIDPPGRSTHPPGRSTHPPGRPTHPPGRSMPSSSSPSGSIAHGDLCSDHRAGLQLGSRTTDRVLSSLVVWSIVLSGRCLAVGAWVGLVAVPRSGSPRRRVTRQSGQSSTLCGVERSCPTTHYGARRAE